MEKDGKKKYLKRAVYSLIFVAVLVIILYAARMLLDKVGRPEMKNDMAPVASSINTNKTIAPSSKQSQGRSDDLSDIEKDLNSDDLNAY